MAKAIVNTDLPISNKLKHLFELQIIDSEIDKIKVLKGELPMIVSDLEDEISGMATRLSKLQGGLADLEKEAGNFKTSIKTSEDSIKKYEKQLDGVKNNREFDALTKEINMQRLEIQLYEKRKKEADEQVKTKKLNVDSIIDKLKVKQVEMDEKKTELEKIIEKTNKEESTLKTKSEKSRKKIETRLLFAYDTIRKRYRNGLAVVTVKRNACGGCFNQIPPQIQLELGLNKKIIACEHCGRVLVDELILSSEE